MSICWIFILNYYNTHYQYKCAIAMIWGYGILYLQFGATLHVNKGLIKNSVIFKIVKFALSLPSYQWSVPQGAHSPQTLYYITSGQTCPFGQVSPRARRMPAGRTQAGNAIATQAPAGNALAGHACSGKG